MRRPALAMLLALCGASLAAEASPFDGEWKATYPCNPNSAVDCAGRFDVFHLWLWSTGTQICGSHLATSNLQDRVDEGDLVVSPSVRGHIRGRSASIAFVSSWGAAGQARLTRRGDLLSWHMLGWHGTGGESDHTLLPDDAVLERVSGTLEPSVRCMAGRLPAQR